MGLRQRLMGEPSRNEVSEALKKGATILDIRTLEEFMQGHHPSAVHIPLNELLHHLHSIPRDRPVVTCNADDAQSATAAEILEAHGYRALDGGSWVALSELFGNT